MELRDVPRSIPTWRVLLLIVEFPGVRARIGHQGLRARPPLKVNLQSSERFWIVVWMRLGQGPASGAAVAEIVTSSGRRDSA